MKQSSNIFIVGPWGAGKSTMGAKLADRLHLYFYDTDRILEARAGVDISWIFDVEGEEGFRRRETELLSELVQLSHIVLSTGGGTIMLPENRRLLAENGVVLYLYTTLNQQLHRTHYNKYKRPLLRCENVKERLTSFYEERKALYEEIADVSCSTNGKSVRVVLSKVSNQLNEIGFSC